MTAPDSPSGISSPGSELVPYEFLNPQQEAQLLAGMDALRIQTKDRQHHLQAYDVRRWLSRIFGLGYWEGHVVESWLTYEERYTRAAHEKDGKQVPASDRVDVAYRVRYRLTVWDQYHLKSASYTEEAMGDAANFPATKRMGAHDFAIKTAESQALKRAAINLGDQFGLSLYGRTPVQPLVVNTLNGPGARLRLEAAAKAPAPEMDGPAAELLPQEAVVSENLVEVPEAEVSWVDQAAAEHGDEAGFGALYNEARRARVSHGTLAAMREAAGFENNS